MAISRGVGPFQNQSAPGTTIVTNCTGLTAGRMLVIIVEWETTGGAATMMATVSGAGNGAATVIAGSLSTLGSAKRQIAYHPNLVTGGSQDVTVTFSVSSYGTVSVMEYQGQDTGSQPDASTSDNGTNTQPSTTLTTTVANALIVAGVTTGDVPSAGSGYTLIGTRVNNSTQDEDEDDVDAGAAGSKTVNFVVGDPTGLWKMSVASFKPFSVSTTPKTFTGSDSLAGGELL